MRAKRWSQWRDDAYPGVARPWSRRFSASRFRSKTRSCLVVCPLAIHYAADRAVAFREFFRVVRPGAPVVFSTQHPTADWLRKGGSYFDVAIEEDVWTRGDAKYAVRFWREPLTSLCAAATNAGFLIERLVEPLPADTMRDRWPEDWAKLKREPGFLLIRLLRPSDR